MNKKNSFKMKDFFIPSGFGQAATTIPIMAPIGDLIGVSR